MKLQSLLLLFFVAVSTVIIIGCSDASDARESVGVDTMTMNISSPIFVHNTMMPRKYTCQGSDVNPPLKIDSVPLAARSLVLIVDDPDAPMGTWDHWIIWNIPIVKEIKENSLPEHAIQGLNSWSNNSYGGPCPPTGTHRYFFKLYALDKVLEISANSGKRALEDAMKGHILAKAELVGLYKKT